MFENLKAGWRLGRETRKLIMSDKKLFVYPIVSALVGLIEFIVLLAAWIVIGLSSPLIWVLLFLFYVVVYFTSTYILIAMLIGFRAHIKGTPISIGEAFSQANQYLKLIFEWAVFDAIITMIIRAIEGRVGSGAIARLIIGSIASFAFAIATFFVVPVIIDEKVGPIDAIKKSAAFIMKNFGKTFGGIVYADLYTLVFVGSGLIILIAGAIVAFSSPALLIAGITVAVVGIAILIFGAVLNYLLVNSVKLILYDYMTGKGNLPKGWDKELIEGAIKKNGQSNNSSSPFQPQTFA